MLKITKDIEKKLANIAEQLPLTTYSTPKVAYKRIDKERILKQTYGEFHYEINHKNRLKTAYKSGGVDAVKGYVNGVIELSQKRIDIAVNL